MSAPAAYRGSLTREQWLLAETRTVARLMLDRGITDERGIVEHVTAHNSFQYPTEREVTSIARACVRRLNGLSEHDGTCRTLQDLIAHGLSDQAAQVNLYAIIRDNRILWDFAATVLATKTRTCDTRLTRAEVTSFLEGLRTQDERIARWSCATLTKIRQVITGCLMKCGRYDRATESLLPFAIDPTLESAIAINGDGPILPAFGLASEEPR